ncbi:MAG TPA: SRPBCC family protein [Vicinamibacterales bacterium]|nr:SRPBCC family protein [Vicinamibacterales bacterium]
MPTAFPLTITMPTDREIVLTRLFDAPPAFVYEALTSPALLRRWYSPTGWTLETCEVDLREGGAWHFRMRKPNGKTVGQRGVYRELVPAARIVNTETWDDWDAGETIVTTTLAEEQGRTRYTSTMLFPSQEVRDVVFKNGLESSAGDLYERLSDLLRHSNA